MSSEAITEKPDDSHGPGPRRLSAERAPSFMREDAPTFARWVGFCGLMSLTLGSVALVVAAAGQSSRVSPSLGFILFLTGLLCLLFHAARDNDMQIRRIYGVLGYLWLISGLVVSVLKIREAPAGAYFLPFGFIGILLGLFFLLPFLRHETETSWRKPGLVILGLVGAGIGLTGLIGANVKAGFLEPYGLLLAFLGLGYFWAFIVLR